jgi:uncharacterized membrane protein YkvI
LIFALIKFPDLIQKSFGRRLLMPGWAVGGITYTGYNVIGAVIILPVLRHLTSRRDAVIAGILCGPLAMVPALIFFVCMAAFYPAISASALPSDFLLVRLDAPVFHWIYQLMIFAALLESGSGVVHAVNERIAHVAIKHGYRIAPLWRAVSSTILLIASIFIAARFGLVTLIANGYRWLAYAFLLIYVLPVMTYGTWYVLSTRRARLSRTATVATSSL